MHSASSPKPHGVVICWPRDRLFPTFPRRLDMIFPFLLSRVPNGRTSDCVTSRLNEHFFLNFKKRAGFEKLLLTRLNPGSAKAHPGSGRRSIRECRYNEGGHPANAFLPFCRFKPELLKMHSWKDINLFQPARIIQKWLFLTKEYKVRVYQ